MEKGWGAKAPPAPPASPPGIATPGDDTHILI